MALVSGVCGSREVWEDAFARRKEASLGVLGCLGGGSGAGGVVAVPAAGVFTGAVVMGCQGGVEGKQLKGDQVEFPAVFPDCAGASVGEERFEMTVG